MLLWPVHASSAAPNSGCSSFSFFLLLPQSSRSLNASCPYGGAFSSWEWQQSGSVLPMVGSKSREFQPISWKICDAILLWTLLFLPYCLWCSCQLSAASPIKQLLWRFPSPVSTINKSFLSLIHWWVISSEELRSRAQFMECGSLLSVLRSCVWVVHCQDLIAAYS